MNAAAKAEGAPVMGSVSLATPTRPVPAIAVAEACVIGLMSLGSSWPSNLPPSAMAASRPRRKLMPVPGLPLRNTRLPSMS